MVDFPNPLGLPEKVVSKLVGEIKGLGTRIDELGKQLASATESWRELARIGTEALPRLDRLDRRAEAIGKVIDQAGPAMEAVVKLEALSEDMIPLAERSIAVIERLIETIDSASDEVQPLIGAIDNAREKVAPLIASIDAAREKVDPLVGTLDASLPALERAINLVEPLEGSVQRLGRALDGRKGRAVRKAAKGTDEPAE